MSPADTSRPPRAVWFAVTACAAFALAYAWERRVMVDDAYITLRYAQNLVNGLGPTWNPGEPPVEGYTNFLWVLLQAIPLRLRFDPAIWAHGIGLASLAETLWISWRLVRLVEPGEAPALTVLVWLALSPTMTRASTAGLETPLHAALVAAMLLQVVGGFSRRPAWTEGRMAGLSLLAAAALLTRLDTAVILAVLGPVVLWQVITDDRAHRVRRLLWGAVPVGTIIGTWLLWKLHFYGNVLPNSYYVRPVEIGHGLRYLQQFSLSLLLLPVAVVSLFLVRRILGALTSPMGVLAAVVVVWCAFVVWAGGDWMHFRLMAPVLPALLVVTSWMIRLMVARPPVRAGLFAVLMIGGFVNTDRLPRLDETPVVHETGLMLASTFSPDEHVRIAVTAAGQPAFDTRFETIDLLGVNDAWVARHGVLIQERGAAHERFAPWSYLQSRQAHLVIGFPTLAPSGEPMDVYRDARLSSALFGMFIPERDDNPIPPEATMLEMGLDDDRRVLAIYLTRHPSVERAIRTLGWRVVPIVR